MAPGPLCIVITVTIIIVVTISVTTTSKPTSPNAQVSLPLPASAAIEKLSQQVRQLGNTRDVSEVWQFEACFCIEA